MIKESILLLCYDKQYWLVNRSCLEFIRCRGYPKGWFMVSFTTYFFILQLILFVLLSIIAVRNNVIVKGNLLIMLSATLLAIIPLHYVAPFITALLYDKTKIDAMLEFFLFTIFFAGLIHLISFLLKKYILKEYYKASNDTILAFIFANLYPVYIAFFAIIFFFVG